MLRRSKMPQTFRPLTPTNLPVRLRPKKPRLIRSLKRPCQP